MNLTFPRFKAIDGNGNPIRGGLLYTYKQGTSTAKSAYTDYALTTAHTNPIVLDTEGEALVYLSGTYKMNLTTSSGAQVPGWPVDNITGRSQILANAYFPDASATDQGVTGDSNTIKYAVDTLGATTGTIYLSHNSGNATTTYTLTTSETIPSNITLQLEPGAILNGAGTLTQNGPIEAEITQIFGSSITVSGLGLCDWVFPEWWGIDGTTDETEINKAIATGRPVFGGKNQYIVDTSPIVITGDNQKIVFTGEIKNSSTAINTFRFGETAASNNMQWSNIYINKITNDSGSGHVFEIGYIAHCKIHVDYIVQNESGKSIIYAVDTGSYDGASYFNTWSGQHWQITKTATISGVYANSTTNTFSANIFNFNRAGTEDQDGNDYTIAVPFFYLKCTAAADFISGNVMQNIQGERLAGGFAYLRGCAGHRIENLTMWDLGDLATTAMINNHIIETDTRCRNTQIIGYDRKSGTENGNKDIMCTAGSGIFIMNSGADSAADSLEFDINNTTATIICCPNVTISNFDNKESILIDIGQYSEFPLVKPRIIQQDANPTHTINDGVITATSSRCYVEIEGGSPPGSDDLDTINHTLSNFNECRLLISAYADDGTIVLKNGTGNLDLSVGDITLDTSDKCVELIYNTVTSKWNLIGDWTLT